MKALSLLVICAGLLELMVPSSQNAFFIPIPSIFAPTTKFSCPNVGTVFTYDVLAWNTNRPNRMIAVEQDQFNCRIRTLRGSTTGSAVLLPVSMMLPKKR